MTDQESHIAISVPAAEINAEKLVLHMDGFEGPLDVLLTLARAQKVDLLEISILELVEQYLAFVQEAKKIKLELAADYLVMAAWLAYLKSRLLLPRDDVGDEPTAEEMALRLQLRLQRLEAMREAGARLMGRDLEGRDTFVRGMPEGLKTLKRGQFDLTLYELLKLYGETRQRTSISELKIEQRPVYPLEEAIERLREMVGEAFTWTQLSSFLPTDLQDKRVRRSALASMFAATLELAKLGKAEIQQAETFGPLYLRQKSAESRE